MIAEYMLLKGTKDMSTKVLLVIAGIGALIWYFLSKSTAAQVANQQRIGLAATVSPYGSASGILTPGIVGSTVGALNGIEAFFQPNQQTNVVQAAPLVGSSSSDLLGPSAVVTNLPLVGSDSSDVLGTDSYMGY
jgi:hypothetical protein